MTFSGHFRPLTVTDIDLAGIVQRLHFTFHQLNLIAQLAVRTGISPLDLMETPAQIIDEMVRLIIEQNESKR